MYRLRYFNISGRLIAAYMMIPALVFLLVVLIPVISSFSSTSSSHTDTASTSSDPGGDIHLVDGTEVLKETLDSLRSTAAYAQARLAISENDRIGLSLDLTTRTMHIEIGGVPVRRCKITDYDLSHSIDRIHERVRGLDSLSKPFILTTLQSSIPRIPVRVVKAPKDSVEARSRPPLDTPEETEKVIYKLWFDRGLTVTVVQSQSSFPDILTETLFTFETRFRTLTESLKSLTKGKLPEPDRWIRIELSDEDARAILRAIPDSTRLALRLP